MLCVRVPMSALEILELPSPEELMPLSQTLITPDLASAFCITVDPPTSDVEIQVASERSFQDLYCDGVNSVPSEEDCHHSSHSTFPGSRPLHGQFPVKPNGGVWAASDASLDRKTDKCCGNGIGGTDSGECGSSKKMRNRLDVELDDVESSAGLEILNEEPMARTLKRPRLVWTPPLHKRFVDAVAQLGIKSAVPKTIMQLMNVEGLTRENVASHLQKYRQYLKRMQGGLSTESSDQFFGSVPVTPTLVASSFVPNYGEDMLPLLLPICMGGQSDNIPGYLGSGSSHTNHDYHDYHVHSAFSQLSSSQRWPQVGFDYEAGTQQSHGSPQGHGHILTLFPSSGK